MIRVVSQEGAFVQDPKLAGRSERPQLLSVPANKSASALNRSDISITKGTD